MSCSNFSYYYNVDGSVFFNCDTDRPCLSRVHQLVRASGIEGTFDKEGHHTSVLVHRVRDWTRRSVDGTGSSGGSATVPARLVAPPAEGEDEILLDQRHYANISRFEI